VTNELISNLKLPQKCAFECQAAELKKGKHLPKHEAACVYKIKALASMPEGVEL
jgi:hypothetical protein